MKMLSFYNDLHKKVASVYGNTKKDKILQIHGLSEDKIDIIEFYNNILNTGLIDSSIDNNANLTAYLNPLKINAELYKPLQKLLGIYFLHKQLENKYGELKAWQYIYRLLDGTFYLHDSTKVNTYYCSAIESLNIVQNGRTWSKVNSSPPRHISSYVGSLVETVFNLSQECAGAVSIPDFFFMFAYMYLKEYKTFEIKNKKVIKNVFQNFYYPLNNEMRVSGDSPFTNITLFDRPKIKELIEQRYMTLFDIKEKDIDRLVDLIINLEYLYAEAKTKEEQIITFPITTVHLSLDSNRNIMDEEFFGVMCKFNTRRGEFNIFCSNGDAMKIQMCCRLSLDNYKLLQDNNFIKRGIDSFGNGAMSVGSLRVLTVNLPRIALQSKDKQSFFDNLKQRLYLAKDILLIHRELVNKHKNMFIAFKYDFLRFENMFETIGFVGLYEACRILKQDIIEFGKDVIEFIEETKNTFVKETNILFNVEQVPAEQCANTLAKLDNVFFDYTPNNIMLYSNQFIPLWEDVDLIAKIKTEGELMKICSGGAIAHINVGSRMNEKQMRQLTQKCISEGLEHFAINMFINRCDNCKSEFYGKYDRCPKCNSKDIKIFSRIVGYFSELNNWSKARRKEYWQRKVVA